MYRFHPQWDVIHDLLGEGAIGGLRTIHSTFTYRNLNPQDYRNVPEYGGGGLLDIGCYSISSARWLFRSEPERVFASVEFDPNFGTDRLVSAILGFEDGTATFTCATQIPRSQRLELHCEGGRIILDSPFNPPFDAEAVVWLSTPDERRQLHSPVANQYSRMAEAFATSVLENEEVPTPLEDARANMAVIDAVFSSGETGMWVEI